MSKVRIQRKRRPWLYHQTRRNFAWARLFAGILGMIATYGGNRQREAYDIARTQKTLEDVRLKEQRQAYVIEQARRTELLNIKTRLELEAKFGTGRVAEMLGEPVPDGLDFTPANYQLEG